MSTQAQKETNGKLESKTQELRDWLNVEIERIEGDIRILENSLSVAGIREFDYFKTDQTRYWGLTSEERNEKMAQDRKKLEELQKRLNLLRSARELDVDIDALEQAGVEVLREAGHGAVFKCCYRFANASYKFRIDAGRRYLMGLLPNSRLTHRER